MPLRAPRDEFESRVFDLHSKGRHRELYAYLFASSMWIPMPVSALGNPDPGGGGQFTTWEAGQLKDWIGVDGHYLSNGYATNGHINQWYGTQGGPEADADLMVLASALLTVNGQEYIVGPYVAARGQLYIDGDTFSDNAYIHINAHTDKDAGVWHMEDGVLKWAVGYDSSLDLFRWYSFVGTAGDRMRLTDAGQLQIGAGTAALPALARMSYVDDGIYFPDDGALGISLGGVEQWRFTTTAFYPIADNAETIGTATLGPSSLFLSDANTTDPAAEGQVIAHGTHNTLAWYLGTMHQLGASLLDTATVVDTTRSVGAGGTMALGTVDSQTVDTTWMVVGNVVRCKAAGYAKAHGPAVGAGVRMNIYFRIDGTQIFTWYFTGAIAADPRWCFFEIEFDATVRSSTELMVSNATLKVDSNQVVAADPFSGGFIPTWAESGWVNSDPLTVAGDVLIDVRAETNNPAGAGGAFCTVLEFKAGLEQV